MLAELLNTYKVIGLSSKRSRFNFWYCHFTILL